jgi:hypothetical protein
MIECPYCNSTYGYYLKLRVSGTSEYNYNFDGTVHEENSQMHDSLNYVSSKYAYCMNCDKRLFKVT